MAGSCVGESDGLTFWVAEQKDYDDVMSISVQIYGGNDYLPHRYADWMTEPDRVVILGRRDGKLVALVSGLIVDEGCTVVVEGLRVCPSERGRGVAGVIQRFADQYIQQLYPSVRTKRQTKIDEPSAGPTQTLSKFTELGRRAGLSIIGDADSFEGFISHLRNKLHSTTGSEPGVSVPQMFLIEDEQHLKNILLDPELPSRVELPGGAIIQDWQVLQPIEGNLEILARRNLTWLADKPERPAFLSFYTPPYPIPYKGGSLRFNIDMFGTDLVSAKRALAGHFEKVRERREVKGRVMVHVYMNKSLWEGMREFCEGYTGVTRCREYWEQLFLERGM
ncbi:N-acetyltransferase 16, like [Oncorhynchus mykiss]|uniref:N-acetyltransferase 16, like n=1 Tax=Oncorhynchus mykiss TaxID=8022 RepID=A0A8C7U2V4_ONCMY|nr:N-acetyltransferase 16, like [Oncorhynchus mykiss]XP_021433367.2 N-acetyltransferase 16, like [Oncorhynchus mykiss]XP_021433368.2 N-acetyltransferase 16, like [Oncorhynchus mykiss]